MRAIVITRGAPGSGKSTWIEKTGLKPYTLCADDIRLMHQSPEMGLSNMSLQISQKNDSKVWATLFDMLEQRMARGELVVIDATHSRRSDFSKYNDLAARYRYRRFYVDFSDVTIETCKLQNLKRPEEKRVPDMVIEKMYSRLRTQQKTSGWVELSKDNFWEDIGIKCFDFSEYENIHIFGDIHGCNDPLQKYFADNPYSENDFYIFTGDYIDRGIQNREVLEFLIGFAGHKNVLFLEGNHERWLYHYSNDEIEQIRSREFKKNTAPQILEIDSKVLRNFYRRLGQLAYFSFHGRKYLVTHGGLSYMPERLITVATEQMIKGVGGYETDIDAVWKENMDDSGEEIVQVHGHRNTFEVNGNDLSWNLEGKIEFGGELRVLKISVSEIGTAEELVKIRNEVFRKEKIRDISEQKVSEIIPILMQFKNSKDVQEKELGGGVSSFNFTRHAFFHGNWNALTCKARGLFVDTENETVVARGFEKFWNVGEVRETEPSHLMIKFRGKPITAYKKYNGFLGLISNRNGKLFIATKSTDSGPYTDFFKEALKASEIDEERLLGVCDGWTCAFEVIDPVNDPHIIKEDKTKVILLDVIKNDFEFEKLPYTSGDGRNVVDIASYIGAECKEIYRTFADEKEFFAWYLDATDENDLTVTDLEGVVIECDGYMVKLKFPYYKFWKQMRGLADKVRHGRSVNFASLWHPLSNYFYAWLTEQSEETLMKDIITLREMFYEQHPEHKCYEEGDIK